MNQLDTESKQIKDELIEKYRSINVDYEWWDCIYADLKIEMETKGISVSDMHFSGFYSQGDGACFTGRIDMAQFLKVHQLEQKYMAATFFAGQGELWANLDQGNSRYYHEQTVSASLVADSYNNYEEDSTRYQVYETMQKVLDDEWKDLEDDVNNICRGYMQDLYRNLRDEHEHLTSDEVVWETIEANELHLEAA
jgi:hypothetical protein